MSGGGFTLSYRRKWENPVFKSKQECAVWAWMCDVAQWQDTTLQTKWGALELKRGELVFAERQLAADFGLYRKAIRSLLSRMQAKNMITLIRDRIPQRAGTVCRILKYDEYQRAADFTATHGDRKTEDGGTKREPQRDRKGTKNNKDKEIKEGKETTAGDLPTGDGDKVAFVGKLGPVTVSQLERWKKMFPRVADPLMELEMCDSHYTAKGWRGSNGAELQMKWLRREHLNPRTSKPAAANGKDTDTAEYLQKIRGEYRDPDELAYIAKLRGGDV